MFPLIGEEDRGRDVTHAPFYGGELVVVEVTMEPIKEMIGLTAEETVPSTLYSIGGTIKVNRYSLWDIIGIFFLLFNLTVGVYYDIGFWMIHVMLMPLGTMTVAAPPYIWVEVYVWYPLMLFSNYYVAAWLVNHLLRTPVPGEEL